MKAQFLFGTLLFLLATFQLNAQEGAGKKGKKVKASIQTSAVCDGCKFRLESNVKKIDGVKSAVLNLGNKQMKVQFDNSLTNIEAIRQVISATGYDADDVKADPAALEKLPACCKPGYKGKH